MRKAPFVPVAMALAAMLMTQCKAPEKTQKSTAVVTATPVPAPEVIKKGVGIDIPNIDKNVGSCDDFFLFANGN